MIYLLLFVLFVFIGIIAYIINVQQDVIDALIRKCKIYDEIFSILNKGENHDLLQRL